ncbi:MAG: mannose-1-phosphate guanylyltransferase/mannose-6-phosphate isomerase, partial [Burkholderiaceae bacterium]
MIPVILSGGSGTRLWPVSREAFPKPFIRLGNGPSLLQRVFSRCSPLADDKVFIVTNETYGFKTREECNEVNGSRASRIFQILEPVGRNTAPAVAIAALAAKAQGGDPVLLILPADHLIPDEKAFQAAARKAEQIAQGNNMVLFGIQPTAPETGFGYIELGGDAKDGGESVLRFVEKPDANTAVEFLSAGNFVWNSGMFCFKASVFLDALGKHAPASLAAAQKVWDEGRRTSAEQPDEVRFDPDLFASQPDISIDYAVMEKSKNIALLRADFHWSDIGSWKAVSEQLPADDNGNTSVGQSMLVGSSNTHVQSDSRLIAAVGVDNLIVIDTPDAVLVAHRDASQEVKHVVAKLKAAGHEAASLHRT